MSRIRRGNYVFITWLGDHPPRHVHVYKDKRLVLIWNLDAWVPMEGRATSKILRHIEELMAEGRL